MARITDWFTEARFGMFIHFGLYSLPAGVWNGERMGRNDYSEWIEVQGNWPHGLAPAEYQALIHKFNPTKFDANQWVSELVNAGMRYLVITSKHHDGFALWPSTVSNFNVAASAFRRDILGELKEACDANGIRFGLYYSHWLDWEHPGGGRPLEKEGFTGSWAKQPSDEQFEIYWREKCLPQVRELGKAYQPDLFWFDTWCENSTPWINERRMDELIAVVKSQNPACLINSRLGIWGHSRGDAAVDFLSMGDNSFPDQGIDQPWETSGTLNESWGYHRLDFNWKSTDQLLGNLVHTTAHGGNYQLNVGPTGEGVFQPAAIRRLREIGGWMVANGESIYGAGLAGLPAQKWGKITARIFENGLRRIYLHVIEKPKAANLAVEGLTDLPKSVRVLETNENLAFAQFQPDVDLEITLPDQCGSDGSPLVIVLEY